MYVKTLAVIIAIALLLAPIALANPLNTVRKAVGEVGGAITGDAPGAAAGSGSGGGARPGVKKHDSNPPGMSFSTVLNGVTYNPNHGKLTLNNLQATFLSNDASGYIILREANGRELFHVNWDVDTFRDLAPYYLLGIKTITDLRTNEPVHSTQLDVAEPGDYVLDFYLPDEHFYTFPFSISKVSGDDPFASKDRTFIDGDWEKWGYMYYTGADPEKSLAWKVWLRNKSAGRDRDVKPKIEVKRGGDLVCVGRDMTITLKPAWNRFEFDLIFPMEGTSGGAYFKAKDLLTQDGQYTLTMAFDDELYGVWKFEVEGGRFKVIGRAVRSQADPLTFIEGGLDAFWYCME